MSETPDALKLGLSGRLTKATLHSPSRLWLCW